MTVGIARYLMNVRKGLMIPPLKAISRFCGFPIGLNTLPVVIPKASASSRGTTGVLLFLASTTSRGGTHDSHGIVHEESCQ